MNIVNQWISVTINSYWRECVNNDSECKQNIEMTIRSFAKALTKRCAILLVVTIEVMVQKVVELFARQNVGARINLFECIWIFNNDLYSCIYMRIGIQWNQEWIWSALVLKQNIYPSRCVSLHFYPYDLHFLLTIAQPGRYSSLVGSSRRSSSFITISHTACERVGQFCKLPWQRCGILKYMVYGQSGGFDNGAVMVESYKNACSSIIVNWLLPPTRKYGARTPTTELSVMFAYFSMMIRMPPISLAQSSTVAFDQKRSSSLCLQLIHFKYWFISYGYREKRNHKKWRVILYFFLLFIAAIKFVEFIFWMIIIKLCNAARWTLKDYHVIKYTRTHQRYRWLT